MIGWFICPYKRRPHPTRVIRYCAMDDFTAQINSDQGTWAEVEVLGNVAIVKVVASALTLTTIGAAANFVALPFTALNTALSKLTAQQRTVLRAKALALGYTPTEFDQTFPDLTAVTAGQLLAFLTTRRNTPRYDAQTDTIFLDGPVRGCNSVPALDLQVT